VTEGTVESTRARLLARAPAAVVALGALAMIAFVVVGRINADEGWYLYAGRLVWRGELPYGDFAFTQMPLMPYLYGVVQSVAPSLVLGRIVSVILATCGLALLVRASRRTGGNASALVVALLCVSGTMSLYNLTISKTYALVLLCFAATFAALTSSARPERALPLACAAAWAATLARTSSLPLTVIVIVFCLWRAPSTRTRIHVAAVAAGGTLLAGAFVLADFTNARFDLLTFHQLLWYDASASTRIDTVVTERVPEWFGDYPIASASTLIALVLVFVLPRARALLREHPSLAVMALGAVGYLALQLPAGQFAPVEYAAPMVPVLFAVTVPVILRSIGPVVTTSIRRGVALGVLAVTVVVALVHPAPWDHLVRPASSGGILHQQDVGALVREHTRDGDEVLAMWAQPIALASGRDFAPDVTLGPFSYEDLTTARAGELHYVNAPRLQRLLESGRPAAVVLSDIDRLVLEFQGTLTQTRADPTAIFDALDERYRRVATTSTWGIDTPTSVEIYVRRPRRGA
jgi:hypothetical protein